MYKLVVSCIVLLTTLLLSIRTEAAGSTEQFTNRENKYSDVKTKYGVVRGHVADDGEYFAYLGVPYAAPPTGINRFKPPSPPLPWDGIFEAKRTVQCPQNGLGDEDCLILNIFTPKTMNEPLPILLYIHGGSFIAGSGQILGVEPLIKQQLIVITINYRLGALGFLCLGIEEAPGNAGMKDQVAALKWVQENIADFGGDPNRVTIYGMSAGAASVDLLVLSKMTDGLFERAIAESAAATPVWTVDATPIETAKTVAKALDFPSKTKNLYKLLDYYLQVPHNLLSKVNNDYYGDLIDGTFGFVPCVERNLQNSTPFLTEAPHDVLIKEKYKKVPMMYMFATSEGLYLRSGEYHNKNYKERMEKNFVDFMPADLIFDTLEIKNEIAKNVRYFYFGNNTIGDDTLMEYLNYFGDYLILHGVLNSAELHSRGDNPVYLMEFAYKGNLGSSDPFYDHLNVSGHADIVQYAIVNKPIKDKNDELTVRRLTRMIGNFVKYGNPTPAHIPLLPVIWPPVRPDYLTFLYFDKDLEINEDPYWDRKVFWDQLYAKFRRPIKPVDPGLL